MDKSQIQLIELFDEIKNNKYYPEIKNSIFNCAESRLYEGLQFTVRAICKQTLSFAELHMLANIINEENEYNNYMDDLDSKYEENISANYKSRGLNNIY